MAEVKHAALLYGNEWPLSEVECMPSPQPPSAKRTKLDFNIQSETNLNLNEETRELTLPKEPKSAVKSIIERLQSINEKPTNTFKKEFVDVFRLSVKQRALIYSA